MTAPIPRLLLPSSATVRVRIADGGMGGRYEEPVVLRHVRFEPEDGAENLSWQLRGGAKGTLFVDAVNTEGAFAIPAGSLVSVDGSPESAVARCEEARSFDRVHHWEVALG